MNTNISRTRIKEELSRQWSDQAVDMALMGRWDDAVQLNVKVLEINPEDVKAFNRLGKAYLELGRLEEALTAYEQCLKLQPSNNIARKRVTELYDLLEREPGEVFRAGALEPDEPDEEDDTD